MVTVTAQHVYQDEAAPTRHRDPGAPSWSEAAEVPGQTQRDASC